MKRVVVVLVAVLVSLPLLLAVRRPDESISAAEEPKAKSAPAYIVPRSEIYHVFRDCQALKKAKDVREVSRADVQKDRRLCKFCARYEPAVTPAKPSEKPQGVSKLSFEEKILSIKLRSSEGGPRERLVYENVKIEKVGDRWFLTAPLNKVPHGAESVWISLDRVEEIMEYPANEETRKHFRGMLSDKPRLERLPAPPH